MENEVKNDYMCTSVFAKYCGVSSGTITNWVLSGVIKPVQQVGSKMYFSKAQAVEIKAKKYGSLIKNSFLGVCYESEASVTQAKKVAFLTEVQRCCPNICVVDSIESIISDITGSNNELADSLLPVYTASVVSAFCKEVKEYVLSLIMGIYAKYEGVGDIPFSFFLGYLLEGTENVWLQKYQEVVPKDDYDGNLEMMRQRLFVRMNHFVLKYGLSDYFNESAMHMTEIYRGILDLGDYVPSHGSFSLGSKRIYESHLKKVNHSLSDSAVQKILSDGFCTVLDGVGCAETPVETFIMSRCSRGDYKTVYLSSENAISAVTLSFLRELDGSGKIKLYIGDVSL